MIFFSNFVHHPKRNLVAWACVTMTPQLTHCDNSNLLSHWSVY